MKTKAWIKAFRLRTLPLAIAIIIAGSAVSFIKMDGITCDDCPDEVYSDLTFITPSLHLFLHILITAFLLQILSNLANDYGDFVKGTDDENRVGPTRALQGGLISKKEMFRAIVITSILSFISGIALLLLSFDLDELYLILSFLLIGILCIVAAIKYTVGKRAYGYNALGDLAVLIFFGGIGIVGTQFLQSKLITQNGVFCAIAYGLWSVAVLNLNNMRDVENDILHKKFTVAYYFGFTKSKIYQAKLILIPYVFSFLILQNYMSNFKALISLSLLPLSLIMVIAIFKVKNREEFDKFLKIQAILTLLNSIVLFSCIYLLHEM